MFKLKTVDGVDSLEFFLGVYEIIRWFLLTNIILVNVMLGNSFEVLYSVRVYPW